MQKVNKELKFMEAFRRN